MKCRRCKKRESTGIIFVLCDPYLDAFEEEGDRRASQPGGHFDITDEELGYFRTVAERTVN